MEQRVHWAMDQWYNPCRAQLLKELRRTPANQLNHYQRLALSIEWSRNLDPRSNWERSPNDIPRAIRTDENGHVIQLDYEAWHIARSTLGAERHRDIAALRVLEQALDPKAFWGTDNQNRFVGQRSYGASRELTVDDVRRHLIEVNLVNAVQAMAYWEYVQREINYRQERAQEAAQRPPPASLWEDPGMPRVMLPQLRLRTTLQGTPSPPPPPPPYMAPNRARGLAVGPRPVSAASPVDDRSSGRTSAIDTEAVPSSSASVQAVATALVSMQEDADMADIRKTSQGS